MIYWGPPAGSKWKDVLIGLVVGVTVASILATIIIAIFFALGGV